MWPGDHTDLTLEDKNFLIGILVRALNSIPAAAASAVSR